MKRRNSIKDMVLESFEGLYKTGTVDERTLREVKVLCLPDVKSYEPNSIVRLRRRLKLSQVALARFINTSAYSVQKWEQGTKKPSGPALKLLHIIDKKGLAGVL